MQEAEALSPGLHGHRRGNGLRIHAEPSAWKCRQEEPRLRPQHKRAKLKTALETHGNALKNGLFLPAPPPGCLFQFFLEKVFF